MRHGTRKDQFNRMRSALNSLKRYKPPDRLRTMARNRTEYTAMLELVLEAMILEAAQAVRNVKPLKDKKPWKKKNLPKVTG